MAEDVRDYVAQLYQQELGRTGADDPGLQTWANAIASGAMSREAVAQAIAQSPEARIADLYQQELGRSTKGDAGASQWVQAVASGQMTIDQAQQAIARSQEGAAYDVNRIYQSELQRAPEAAGMKAWSDALMAGAISEQQFLDAVRQSEEYKKLNMPPPAPPPIIQQPLPTPTPGTNTAPALERYTGQLQQLQQQAIDSAAKGYFEPTYAGGFCGHCGPCCCGSPSPNGAGHYPGPGCQCPDDVSVSGSPAISEHRPVPVAVLDPVPLIL